MTEWVNMRWLMEQTGIKSHATIKSRILEPHKDELCKFVRYPQKQGQPWQFSRVHMQE